MLHVCVPAIMIGFLIKKKIRLFESQAKGKIFNLYILIGHLVKTIFI